jgi:hypothetical protein
VIASVSPFSLAFVGLSGENVVAAEAPKPGTYALFPGRLRNCSRGNFCADGKNQACPIGFKCPYDHMSLPIRCEPNDYHNTTCFQTGLADEMPCPAGFVCKGMDVPPIPIPAGYYLPNITSNAREGPGSRCYPGDFCALAAPDPPPKCPEGFFCPNTSIILPEMCPTMYDSKGVQVGNYSAFCPAGSANASACPVGFSCITPLTQTRCQLGQWCPSGSQFPKDCPGGRLCEAPSTNEPCPAGFYCPYAHFFQFLPLILIDLKPLYRGATYNPIRCSPLSLCAEGSQTERRWMALLIESIAIIVVAVGGKLLSVWNARRWKKRAQRREEQRKGAVNRYAALASFGHESEADDAELPLLSDKSSSSSHSEFEARPKAGLSIEFRNLQLLVGSKDKQKGSSPSFSVQRHSRLTTFIFHSHSRGCFWQLFARHFDGCDGAFWGWKNELDFRTQWPSN